MKKIGVFTSGGDAPGMNAAIRAVVRTAIYNKFEVFGIRRGFEGMIDGDMFEMKSETVSNIIQRGGTILKTARDGAGKTMLGFRTLRPTRAEPAFRSPLRRDAKAFLQS